MIADRLILELVALVAPPRCAVCQELGARPADLLCPACRRELPWLRGPTCPRCALPAPCEPCPARRSAFVRSWAPLAYEGTARELIAALKFRGALGLADIMAAQLVAGAPGELLSGSTALVPVPAHRARRRKRGFDQAELLARALSRRTGRPLRRCLRRTGAPTRQLGAHRRERLTPGRIGLTVTRRVPAAVLLVDDVHTTGATLHACAAALRGAGAGHVACITYARTLSPGLQAADKRSPRA